VVRTPLRVKHWEIIADNLSKAGWSLGLRLSRGFLRANDAEKYNSDAGAFRTTNVL
jgi:hypothetical protein